MGSNTLLLLIERNEVTKSNLVLKISALGDTLRKSPFVWGPL